MQLSLELCCRLMGYCALTCMSKALHQLGCDRKALPFAVHELTPNLLLTRQHRVLCQRAAMRQSSPCPLRYGKWAPPELIFSCLNWSHWEDWKAWCQTLPRGQPLSGARARYPLSGHATLQPSLLVAGLGSGGLARLPHHLFPEERMPLRDSGVNTREGCASSSSKKRTLFPLSIFFPHLG